MLREASVAEIHNLIEALSDELGRWRATPPSDGHVPYCGGGLVLTQNQAGRCQIKDCPVWSPRSADPSAVGEDKSFSEEEATRIAALVGAPFRSVPAARVRDQRIAELIATISSLEHALTMVAGDTEERRRA